MTELDEIFGESNRPVSFEDIQSLRYMEQVIQETWRLFPPIPMIAKKPTTDIQLENCVLPEGSTIAIIIMAMHRNPTQFPNPDVFNPDNFLPERIKARHPYSFIPFSAGSRTCIGAKYAMLLVKVMLATLLRSYRVYSKRRERDFVLAGQTVLKRREGFLINLKPREKSSMIIAAA
ncbi:hypothetical protein ILUMI_11483 [Ignelater luminosus]|uniref:Cytochrome P450 n=1 Tax=Ignelater luminosus TaxID=2038154 RepID=A0A8K0G7P3_IGNLU|nr:hypothetical protein ILUMI_11483 [Ignelater luminosus]